MDVSGVPLRDYGSLYLRDSPHSRAGRESTLSPAGRVEQSRLAYEMFLDSSLPVHASDDLIAAVDRWTLELNVESNAVDYDTSGTLGAQDPLLSVSGGYLCSILLWL